MPTTNISFRRRGFTSNEILTLCGVEGKILFDNNTERIYLGTKTTEGVTEPIMFGTPVKNIVWNNSTKDLTITKIDGSSNTINIMDATSGSQPNSLLSGLRDDVNINKSNIQILTNSIQTSINNRINTLDGNATISSKNGNVVTIKTGITETDGIVSNASGTDIVLSEVAVTGDSNDISVNYTIGSQSTSTVQDAITNISTRISSLESAPTVQTIVCRPQANEIPEGAIYSDGTSTITGTMAASASTVGNIYLVSNGVSSYNQYVTTQGTSGYVWTSLGSTTVDLSGYVKSVTVNGNQISTANGTTNIQLGNLVSSITGQSAIGGGNSTFIAITPSSNTSGGQTVVSLSPTLKIKEITNSSQENDGVATAYDVKTYVEDNLTTIKTWTREDTIMIN